MRKEVRMMKLKQRFIMKASVGFALGILVDLIIHAICVFMGDHYLLGGNVDKAMVLRFLMDILTGGLLGFVGNGSSVIYEIESWSILKVTATHFVIAYGAFVIIGLFNGWITPEINLPNLVVSGTVLLVYIAIWLIQYFVYKKEVREINIGIRQLHNKGEGAA